MAMKKVGILIFNDVEVLDMAGPFEVFSLAEWEETREKIFKVYTIAKSKELITARNGLKVQPDFAFEDAPEVDILIVPGGYGAEETERYDEMTIGWLKKKMSQVEIMASVCTGAFLLAEAGFLDGREATTHWMDLDRLKKEYPNVKVLHNMKYVDASPVFTSGGISAGINMSFYILEKLAGSDIVRKTARRMEYDCYC